MKLKALLFCALALTLSARAAVDQRWPDYHKVAGIAGNLSSVGSDTLANLMTLWAEDFMALYPAVTVQVQASGSSTAPPALSEGTASFGPMSRRMKARELAAFEQRHGYPPTAVPVAIDAMVIVVNKDNPIKEVSLAAVDAIFSETRRCGGRSAITTWGELGLTGFWQNRPIQLYGRNSVSGTYGYFKEAVLCQGDFRRHVNEQPGSASVVQAVGSSVLAMGYSPMGYQTANVRVLAISRGAGQPPVLASAENAAAGRYPLARFLYVYVNRAPGRALPPLEREFLKLLLSRQGQRLVVREGFIPLPWDEVAAQRAALGLAE